MDQTYWIIEYVKLLLAYGFVLFVWPSVVFRPHLKGKGARYRFAFCTTVTVLLITTCVLMMGLLHILHPWTTIILFYGVFAVQLWRNFTWDMSWIDNLRRVSASTMSWKQLVRRAARWVVRRVRMGVNILVEWSRGKRLELALLLLLVIFGMIYFSYGAFDEHSYGFGDQYVHHQWIYGLKQGKSFYDGIYPEGMHCMIYLTTVCFGIRLYTGVLFFAGLQSAVLLISIWLFLREVFCWRYTPLIVLCMYLTFDQTCINEIFGMSRLSWTLPLEFALYSVFLAGAAFLRFCRRARRGERLQLSIKQPVKLLSSLSRDQDLLILLMAVSASLAIHFYATIIAFFFCFGIAVIFLRHLLKRGVFWPLVVSVMIGFFVAVLPMGTAFAAGYPLQGSLGWAMSVMEGTDEEYEDARNGRTSRQTESASSDSGQDPGEESASTASSDAGAGTNNQSLAAKLFGMIRQIPIALYEEGYHTLYSDTRSKLIIGATIFTILSSVFLQFFLRARARKKSRQEDAETVREVCSFDGHLAAAIISVILMFLYVAPYVGLPALVAGSRLCNTEQVLCLMMYAVPVDYLLTLLGRLRPALPLRAISALLVFGVYLLARGLGIFHGYLYYELTRYDAAVSMTNWIIDKIPKHMATIVSTTDELYQIIEHGYHEELLTFINYSSDPTYTLPTPYVFVYIEKRPIQYAQYHFAQGPSWLAAEKYLPFYQEGIASQCPEIISGEISLAQANKDVKYGGKLSDTASDLEGRTILESKLFYKWKKEFSGFYPYESSVIYEDDDFMCLCFTQNVDSLFSLGGIESVP